MLIELQQDNLQEVLNDHSEVIVQYSGGWCGNCRLMKPKFKRLSTENEGSLL
jgi:thiol-disulfide isomerase/thioredoxin